MEVMLVIPVEGKPFEEVMSVRGNGIKALVAEGYGVADTVYSYNRLAASNAAGSIRNWALAKLSLYSQMASSVEAVYFADGWEQDSDCKALHELISGYGIEIRYMQPPETAEENE